MKYTALATEKKTEKMPEKKPAKSGKVVARKAKPPGEIRIIGGQYKRTKLPVANKPGLRPTPDRVRETLFNWLGQDLTGWRCADVFAGTGALGFEAASRGAAEVVLVERDPQLVRSLRASRERLQASRLRIEAADAVTFMRRGPAASQDLVFLDPPFDAGLFESALAAAAALVAPGGFVYLEADRLFDATTVEPLGLHPYRHAQAGAVHFHLFQRPAAADTA